MTQDSARTAPIFYEILIKGHLDARWASRLGDLVVTAMPNGQTRLYGPVLDQAALHGILSRIRDLGLVLISVQRVEN